jgi:hypothetical protein
MAMVAPFLVLMMAGLWEVGRCVTAQSLIASAAREGGRLAASGAYFSSNNSSTSSGGTIYLNPPSTNTPCEVQKKVLLYLQCAGVTTTGCTVTVANNGTTTTTKSWSYTYAADGTITGSGYDPSAAASQLDQLVVTVTLPYKNVSWSPLNMFISKTATLSVKVAWTSMVDTPFSVTSNEPSHPLQASDPIP